MEIHIITAFPNMFSGILDESILRRARQQGAFKVYLHDIRHYAKDKHQQIDDYPYGGGAGMILKPEPIFDCIESVIKEYELADIPVTLLTPVGESWSQSKAVEYSLRKKLILLCGHYKGLDQRIIDELVDEEISVGDYILTGGEIAAMCIIDSVVRLLPGALNDIDSAVTDSFQTGLLDHPHYTRPEVFRGRTTPKVLLSGNHAEIEKWRMEQAVEITRKRRPDIYQKFIESENDD